MGIEDIMEYLGEEPTAAVGGLLIGIAFGFLAQRSRFCLRAAVIDFTQARLNARVAVWLLAFSAAVVGTQGLIAGGWLAVGEARQLASPQSLSGALIGGALFGIGMVLARGCAARLLVLSATGNLRALLSGMVLAVVAQASLRGVLAPARTEAAGWWVPQGAGANNLLGQIGLSADWGLILGGIWLMAAIYFTITNRLSPGRALAAFAVGLLIPGAWWLTYLLSQNAWEPMQVESLTFTGPSADTLMLVLSAPTEGMWDFDVGLVPGVFLGSLIAALLFKEFKWEGFQGGESMRRYIVGAVLMGFGGMLAGGCAVGAGVTGGAIFALTSWVALTSIWAAASLTHILLDRGEPSSVKETLPADLTEEAGDGPAAGEPGTTVSSAGRAVPHPA